MKKNLIIAILSILVVIFAGGWYVNDQKAQDEAQASALIRMENGRQIKTDKFTVEYEDDGNGDYTLMAYPNKKDERFIAQQGDGAQGLEIVSVQKSDQRVTSAN